MTLHFFFQKHARERDVVQFPDLIIIHTDRLPKHTHTCLKQGKKIFVTFFGEKKDNEEGGRGLICTKLKYNR
jgi:hypothetical protein